MNTSRWLFLGAVVAACGGPAVVPALRRPDGGWHLKCGSSLDACVNRASVLCKERGYVVISGMSRRRMYGAELGVSQVAVRDAELDVACADFHGQLPTVQSSTPACASPAPGPPAKTP